MRFRPLLSLALLAAVVATGCNDSTTAPPTVEPDPLANKAFVLELTVKDGSENGSTEVLYGKGSVDTNYIDLGQQYISRNDSYRSMLVLNNKETASIFARPNGAAGYPVQKPDSLIFQVFSDWNAVNPKAHPGVVYNDVSEFIFYVGGYKLDNNNFIDWDSPINPTLYAKTVRGIDPSARLALPYEPVMRYIFPSHRIRFGCAGNDTLAFRSTKGMTIHHEWSGKQPNGATSAPIPIPEVTVICSMYSSEAVANAALASRRKLGR
jgi:hypothetical protein